MKRILNLALFAGLLCLVVEGCSRSNQVGPAQRSTTIVLQYDDFGPDIVSSEYLGMPWYQWQSEGGEDPNTKFDIKVIVYRNVTLDEVKKRYPVIAGQQDYRYLEYAEALELLGKYENLPIEEQTKDKARRTKQKILRELGA